MNYCKVFFLCLTVMGCCSRNTNLVTEVLKTCAPQFIIQWDENANKPTAIVDADGFTLKPCDAGNEKHQDLFIFLYTDPEAIKGYLHGKPMSTPEALHVLLNQSYQWEDGNFLSGFVGYSSNGTPFMHCGIRILSNKHMAELFLIELPGFRNKGYGEKAMAFLDQWASFINTSGTNINGDNKHTIRTLIARVSPDNIPATKLLLSSGFKSDFAIAEFNHEMPPRPDHVKLTHSTLTLDGKSHNVTIITTPKHPDPNVIFIKRIQ